MNARLSKSVLVAAVLTAMALAAYCGVSAAPASALTAHQRQVVAFINANVDRTANAAVVADSAVTAAANGRYARAARRLDKAVTAYASVARGWVSVPFGGDTTRRIERQYGALLNNVRIYISCANKVVYGRAGSSTIDRAMRAWDRATANYANVLVELARLY
jgi:hypothetical protein